MEIEWLTIDDLQWPYIVIPIDRDGSCLFGSISYLIYNTPIFAQEIRQEIIGHVTNNWEQFSVWTHDHLGNNYSSLNQYVSEMTLPSTFGSYCELVAAGQLYPYCFEVYRDCKLYVTCGTQQNPVKKLRFTGDLSVGHFDVYLQCESPDSYNSTENKGSSKASNKRKRRARFSNSIRKKQLNEATKTYAKKNPEINRAAVAKYHRSHPEVHRAAVAQYQKNNPEIHRKAKANHQRNNPDLHRESQSQYRERQHLPWKNKANSAMEYNPEVSYETDKSVELGKMSHKCKFCMALKWKDESAGMCCSNGKVQLEQFESQPDLIHSLITDNHPEHKHFIDNIRKYNGSFQMTSFGAKKVFEGGFMPTFKVQGQVYHMVGSLLPLQEKPQFLQIYFVGEPEREADLRCQNFPDIKQGLVKQLQRMLHEVNKYVKELKTTIDRMPQECESFQVVIHAEKAPARAHAGRFNAPACGEVALVIVGQQFEKRDIILQSHDNKLHRISELHRSYDALQYPLMFCRGEDGYSIDLPLRHPITKHPLQDKTVSAACYYAYRIMIRSNENNEIHQYHSLFSQYLVDMYAKVETERLNYIRKHQKELRSDNYIHLKDALGRQDINIAEVGQLVVLPSSFTGGPRYMHEKTQDAMTYVRHYGRPDLFITFTCNPKWPSIADALLPSQKPHDRHDIIARVFHLKVKKMIALLTKGNIFGETQCFMYSVEWQKRGLPHVHILLWLKRRISANIIDNVICAEIPDPGKDPLLHELVKNNMIHGPCGTLNPNSPCIKQGKCSKQYPRPLINDTQTGADGYPKYRRRSSESGGFTVKIKEFVVDNRWVVPYNPVLLRTFGAHINVEMCNSVKSIKYICKYVNKGSDQAAFGIKNEKDEVEIYETGRYISSAEAVWRILAFPIHERYPPVLHLAVHLENGQRLYFTSNNIMQQITNPPKTTLLGFFELCITDDFAKTLLYSEVPSYYVWKNNKFERRKLGKNVDGWQNVKKGDALGRVYTIHPNNIECFHLRMLLHVIKGPTSFLDLKTVNCVVHPTFQSACLALGLLEDDAHWDSALEEAALSDHPIKLRDLFTIMLVHCQLSNPFNLWEKHRNSLSEDIKRRLELQLDSEELINMKDVYNRCLILIENGVMSIGGQSLPQYGLPQPSRSQNILPNREYLIETSYDVEILEKEVAAKEINLTNEQQMVYHRVLESIETGAGQLFFLDAPGGTGKTFLINLLLQKIRSHGHIALAVASSGIAATLLEGGKTAHAAFKLPLTLIHQQTPVCSISKQSNLAQVLRECKLIVWDESTMAHKGGFEALCRALQDIKSNNSVMGGVTVLLAGDFRQTLPVVPRGTRADEVEACLKSSYLWNHTHKLFLRKNMRVHLRGDDTAAEFSKILLTIGDGKYPNIQGLIKIPASLGTVVNTLSDLTQKIYPEIANINMKSNEWLCERAILTPKNDRAAIINNSLLNSFDSPEMEYLSIDSVKKDDVVNYPVEFLNSLNPPGFPPHKLILKIGTPVMLLRNFKPTKLCNGTRLRVKALHKNVIEATVLTGCAQGESVFIPRIPLIPTDYPFEFKRLQFPLKISFAITINKSQGQSLRVAGIDLSEECFSHGQFYVACSRVSSSKHLYVLTSDGKTANIVYKEVLR